jgi:RNA polymerase sigma factor (sigma-70 family)
MDTSRIELALHELRMRRKGSADRLIEIADERAQSLTRRFLSAFPTVAAWYETGDVRQLALLRLNRTFAVVEIQDAAHFHRLIARKIRETLLDLKRQIQGPRGLARFVRTGAGASDSRTVWEEPQDDSLDPRRLSEWLEIHQAIDSLPPPHREMFDLLWYGDLSQEDAADALGISTRHVRRRWNQARLALYAAIPEAFDR